MLIYENESERERAFAFAGIGECVESYALLYDWHNFWQWLFYAVGHDAFVCLEECKQSK